MFTEKPHKLEIAEEIQKVNVRDEIHQFSIQSMTNTYTRDVETTCSQVQSLLDAGCNIIRISTPTLQDVTALQEIIRCFQDRAEKPFFIADVHYDFQVAMEAARIADRIRINPGNFLTRKELNSAHPDQILDEKIKILSEVCRRNKTSIRIGLNQGSIYKEGKIIESSQEMVDTLLDYTDRFVYHNFRDLILSIKSSDPWSVIESNTLLQRELDLRNYPFEIHLGVTEAGNKLTGRIRSALGIGNCLVNNIGQTIRVSLTEDPVNEIVAAREIISASKLAGETFSRLKGLNNRNPKFDNPILVNIGSSDFKNQWHGDYVHESIDDLPFVPEILELKSILNGEVESNQNDKVKLIRANIEKSDLHLWSIVLPVLLKGGFADGLLAANADQTQLEIAKEFIQVSGDRKIKSDFVSCPSCSRTNFDIEKVLNEIQQKFSSTNLKFSVMGCGVNGYGEMSKSDIGIIGSAKDKVDVYLKQKKVRNAIPTSTLIDELENIIENDF